MQPLMEKARTLRISSVAAEGSRVKDQQLISGLELQTTFIQSAGLPMYNHTDSFSSESRVAVL